MTTLADGSSSTFCVGGGEASSCCVKPRAIACNWPVGSGRRMPTVSLDCHYVHFTVVPGAGTRRYLPVDECPLERGKTACGGVPLLNADRQL